MHKTQDTNSGDRNSGDSILNSRQEFKTGIPGTEFRGQYTINSGDSILNSKLHPNTNLSIYKKIIKNKIKKKIINNHYVINQMARIARVVVPGIGHHITQRGVRSMNIFRGVEDKKYYIKLLSELSLQEGLEIHAYCLMDNHIHLLAVPKTESSLRKAIGETHRLYTRKINFEQKVRGHLFQERFFSCPLSESHYIATARYIERNPVRAKMCRQAWDYKFSSAKYHVGQILTDPLLAKKDWYFSSKEWQEFLLQESAETDAIRKCTKTGRPIGDKQFIKKLEQEVGRNFSLKKPGPKVN